MHTLPRSLQESGRVGWVGIIEAHGLPAMPSSSIPELVPVKFGLTEQWAAKRFFEANGYVVLTGTGPANYDKFYAECADILNNNGQDWRKVMKVPKKNRFEDYLPTFNADDFRPGGKAHSVNHKNLRFGAFPHSGFGAPCTGTSFNGHDQWAQRGNAPLREMAARLAGVDDVRNIIAMADRKFIKFHEAGAEEFVHVDLNGKCLTQPRSGHEGLQGKFMVSKGSFLMSAGSHKMTTDDWAKYVNADKIPRGDKFSIDKKHDPCQLWAQQTLVMLEPGDLILWSPYLVHGVLKNKSGHAALGWYISFNVKPSADAPRKDQEAFSQRVGDMLRSWLTGDRPDCFPSGDKVHTYPARYKNFPKMLEAKMSVMHHDHPNWRFFTRVNGKNETVPDVTWVPSADYVPPPIEEWLYNFMLENVSPLHEFPGHDPEVLLENAQDSVLGKRPREED